jgi:hypothetical protein
VIRAGAPQRYSMLLVLREQHGNGSSPTASAQHG